MFRKSLLSLLLIGSLYAGRASAAGACILDWNGDGAVNNKDIDDSDNATGFYWELFFYTSFDEATYRQTFPNGNPAALDFNHDGAVNNLDIDNSNNATGFFWEHFYWTSFDYGTYVATFPNGACAGPSAPTVLAATATSSTQINLSWKDNSSNEAGFKVERAPASTGPFTQIAVTASGATTYSDTLLPPGKTYYYRVRAYASAGESGYSNLSSAATKAQTVPAAPSTMTAISNGWSSIQVNWKDNSDNEAGFKVERANAAAGPWVQVELTHPGSTMFEDSDLSASTTYYYRVRATNSAGDSGNATVSGMTQSKPSLGAPAKLSAAAASESQINLTWTDGSSSETGFKVERATTGPGGPWTQIGTPGANVTTYSDTGVSVGTKYYYQVRATNGTSNSNYSNIAATEAGVPSNLTATEVSGSQINLTWTNATSNVTGFKIERSIGNEGAYAQIGTTAASVTSYSDAGVLAGNRYFYRVRATKAGGDTGYSKSASAVPTSAPDMGTPSGMTATAVTASQVNLTWTDGSGLEQGFKVFRATSANGPFIQIGEAKGSNGGPVSYVNDETGFKLERAASASGPWSVVATNPAGLSGGATYYFRVSATSNQLGDSDYSNTANVTMPAKVPTTLSGLTASGVGCQMMLSWANGAGDRVTRTDSGLSKSKAYYYRVKASNTVGDSGYSNTANSSTQAMCLVNAWTGVPGTDYSLYGEQVASAGDVNGDGYEDLVVGARTFGTPQDTGLGKAFVYLGGPGGLSATPAWTAVGKTEGEFFGHSVASAGDVNKDGYSDLIVGASDYGQLAPHGGRAYLYLGSRTGLSTTPSKVLTIGGTSYLGVTVASAGDVNKDGYADVLVGDFLQDSFKGKAYLFMGGPTGLSASPAWTGSGAGISDQFGVSMASAGDVDKDGYADVLIGASGFPGGSLEDPISRGKVYLYRGGPGGLAQTPSWTVEGVADHSAFGGSVASAGDVNKDGYVDVIIGASNLGGGNAFVYLGGSGGLALSPSWTVSAPTPTENHYFGCSVKGAGDVNQDGYSDVLVGDFGTPGGASLYLGGPSGVAQTPVWGAVGEDPLDHFSYSLAAGDFNGDGNSDVVIGAERVNDFTGKVYLYLGADN